MRIKSTIYLFAFFLSLFAVEKVQATHIMGGEITWECLDNGQYIFTVKIYRDCNGVNFNTNNHALEWHRPDNGLRSDIGLTFFSVTDITPACEGSPCATLAPSDPDIPGAIEEYVLKSDSITLTGIPGVNGWIFSWTYGNRNAAIDNIVNAQNFGITLRAKMYAYNGQTVDNCFDSSPDFFEKPSSIICGGEKFTYNHSAYDEELDSLSYSWAEPLDGNFCNPPPCRLNGIFNDGTQPINVQFDLADGFSFDSPYPDTNLDIRNIPAVLDSSNGEITFTSYTTGEYVSVIRVTAYKCGIRVAEIYRELQTVITTGCASNEPPEIAPLANGTYNDTVKVGDMVIFDINVLDSLRTDNPKDDSIFFYASGIQFGANYTDSTTGCLSPPCATLSNPAPDTGVGSYQTTFRWRTSCDHLASNTPSCATSLNTHLFVIRTFDDFCPAAGQTIATFAITVIEKELVPNPEIFCADIQANGDVIIKWDTTSDPDSSFVQWKIYSATDINGPYSLIDSIQEYDSTRYQHVSANADQQERHYIVRAESGCNQNWTIQPTDTISTLFFTPTFNDSCVTISWTPLATNLPLGSSATYDVYREYPIGSGFTLYRTTAATSFCDTFSVCEDTVTYQVILTNSSSLCVESASSLIGYRFQHPDITNTMTASPNVQCFGQSDALAYCTPQDGIAPYTYLWSTGDNTDTAKNLSAGKYYLTITDSKNCTLLDSITITEPDTLIASLGDSLDVSCFGFSDGWIYATAIGGTTPYSYLWSDNQTTDTAENLVAGAYTVTITDANGCTSTFSSSISEPVILSNTMATQVNVSCFGLSDAIAYATPAGGTTPYSFLWSDSQTSDTARNLPAGKHYVTVTDNQNCTLLDSITITEPDTLIASLGDSLDVSCFGFSDGWIYATAIGGTTPYSYLWSDNQTTDTAENLVAGAYTVTITDTNGCTSTFSSSISEPIVLSNITDTVFNVSCNGLSDAIAYATTAGGTTPYSFLWSDSQTSDTARNLPAGKHYVTVTDNQNCTLLDSITITEPDTLIASLGDSLDVSCFGFSDGWIYATAIGGTTPYSYLWSDNQTTDTAENLVAGAYTVTITDTNGCTSTFSSSISEPVILSNTMATQVNVSCFGLSDAIAYATPAGGTSPYSFLWSDSQTSDTARNLPAGKHYVTVTDNQNCTLLDSITITEPDTLIASLGDSLDVSCFGFSDGWIYATAIGGTTPYSYLWSDNQTTDTAKNIPAGTYTVTITDANGCTSTFSSSISEPVILSNTMATQVNVSCFGLSDAIAYATPAGGTTPYSFLWSDSQTSDTARNLPAGKHYVTVTDNQNCTLLDSITITEPDTLIASLGDSLDVSCFGFSDGWIYATAIGGTTPYSYLWSDNQTTDTAKNITAGTYTVTITDANGCTSTFSSSISEPVILSNTMATQVNVSCFGLSDAIAYATPAGGTTPYSFLWSDSQTSDTARNLPAGKHYVTVTDNQNCTLLDSITITEPDTLIASLGDSLDVSCFGFSDGWIYATAIGGTTPYSYLWSDNQTTDTAKNITAGTYTVTITDANGCTSTFSSSISEPVILSNTMATQVNVSCFGLSDAIAYATPAGGTTPYSFLWSDSQTSDTARNLPAGKHYVTVTDNQNCTLLDSITITEPDTLIASLGDSLDVSCFGFSDGWIYATAIGGTTPYSYLWSDNQTTDTAENLVAGTYTVTITDANGCTSTFSSSISEPIVLSNTMATQVNVSCFGLSDAIAYVTPAGGTSPYSFLWSDSQTSDTARNLPAGKHYVTVTDNQNCTLLDSITITEPDTLIASLGDSLDVSCFGFSDGWIYATAIGGTTPYSYLWSDNQTTDTAENLVAGAYTVTITDTNGCTSTFSSSISEPIVLSNITDTVFNVSCNGLSDAIAYATTAGGTTPYSFLWSDNQITDTAINLAAGKYYVTVIDSNSCFLTDSILITEPEPLTSEIADSSDVSCFGFSDGWANVSVSGGTKPYTYFWSENQDKDTIIDVEAGTYTVTVSDFKGCLSVSEVTINEPPLLEPNLTGTPISCFGFDDGTINSAAIGGVTPYTYNWSNNETTSNIVDLAPSTYQLTLTDSNGCVQIASYTVVEPAPISLNISSDDIVCINVPKTISVSGSGGTGTLTYTWSNNLGATTDVTVTPQSNTTYTVSATDQNNCPTVTADVTISVRNIYNDFLELRSSGDICRQQSTELSYTHTGDFPSYTYTFNNGLSNQNPQTVNPSVSTVYVLTVTDVCGNFITDSVLVNVSSPPPINLPDTLIEKCVPFSETFDNNTPRDYTYLWDFGNGNTSTLPTPVARYELPGQYNVILTITTPEGCDSVFGGNYLINALPTPVININASPEVTSIKDPIISFNEPFGEPIEDSVQWMWDFDNGDTSILENPTITYEDTGSYVVSLWKTNRYNCSDTGYKVILIEPFFEIKIPNAFTPSRFGGNGGAVFGANQLDGNDSRINQVFHPFVEYTQKYRLMIFNRWGELIFESNDANIGWDGYYKGVLSQADVYVYKLEVTFMNGQKATQVGDITLLR